MTEIDQSHIECDTQAGLYNAWSMEPDSELRTMPAAWDLSELMTPPRPSRNGKSKPLAPPMADSSEGDFSSVENDPGGWRPEPFPEPKTYPVHWDFSE